MTDIRGIRHIKTVQGLTSCTYWEAVVKLHNQCKGTDNIVQLAMFAVTLSLIFERNSKDVAKDLERGTP